MAKGDAIIVTIRKAEGGGMYEFTPQPDEEVRYVVYSHGELVIEKAPWPMGHKGWTTVRCFAPGVWADVEVIPEGEE